jgi:acetyl-CoA carboxylase/biotin carboxylase 1
MHLVTYAFVTLARSEPSNFLHQAGSTIVENLRTYSSPVFVYIPKTGELRGGAWVVVDSQINSDMVEMYADPSARGNVLEPEGLVEIKYRSAQLVETMHRLDQGLGGLDRQLEEERKRPQPLPGRVKELQDRIKVGRGR